MYHTSAYRSAYNGNVESAIGQIRTTVERISQLTDSVLMKVVFAINTVPSQDGSGTPASPFFRRGLRTLLPNSLDREVDRRDLIKKRADKQMKLYLKKGRSTADQFHVGDKVRAKDPVT